MDMSQQRIAILQQRLFEIEARLVELEWSRSTSRDWSRNPAYLSLLATTNNLQDKLNELETTMRGIINFLGEVERRR